jgi:hypothetical protein
MSSASVIFDILARDRASDKFQKIGKSADASRSKMAALAKFGKVGLGVLAVGAAAAAGGIGLMVKAAIDDEKSQSKLAQTLKNTTGATKGQIASVEDWITAQGKAFGVADDDLRPALDKLAVATGSVGKSQKLASLAMNVSAGTGKSLQAVTMALAKGYAGNTTGLSRLGIATKDAEGKTKTFSQIQGELAQKFKGQAATAADTFAGRFKRFKIAISEAGESIGYSLLPLLSRMAGFIVDKAIPAIGKGADKVSDFFSKIRRSKGVQDTFDKIRDSASRMGDGFAKARRALDKIKDAVGSLDLSKMDGNKVGQMLGDALVSGLARLGKLTGKIGAILGDLFAKVDWVGLGISIGKQAPALVVGLVAGIANFDVGSLFKGIMAHWSDVLIAVLVIAFAPAKFAGAIGRVLSKIPFVGKFLAAAVVWINSIGGRFKSFAGDLMKSFWEGFTHKPIPGASIVSRILSGLKGIPGAVFGFYRSLYTRIGVWALDAFGAAGRGARTATGKLVSFVASIPGKIVRALGNLGGLLIGAGKAVIDGLISGITSKIGELGSKLKGVTNFIKNHKGPIEKDRILLTPAGVAIMQGLVAGLKKGYSPVKDFLQKVTDKVAETGDKLKELISSRNDFAGGFQSFGASIFGRDPGQDADGNALPESVSGIKAFAAAQAADAAKLAANVQRLVGLGLNKELLAQMKDSGPSGLAQINALAAGASKADIGYLNSQNKATSASLNAAGMSAANAVYGSDIAIAKRDADAAAAVAKAVREALKDHMKMELHAVIKGSDIYLSYQREEKKQHGGKR